MDKTVSAYSDLMHQNLAKCLDAAQVHAANAARYYRENGDFDSAVYYDRVEREIIADLMLYDNG